MTHHTPITTAISTLSPRRRLLASLVLGSASLLTLGLPTAALANDVYPSKPIKFIVPYPPGGGTDIIGRLLAAKLQESWGQTTLVENKTGAGGTLGNDAVAKSPGDGYTVLIGITAIIQAPGLYTKLPYDVFKDLTPVSELARSGDLFVVHNSVPANTLKDFVALVKANPGKYSVGSYGNGTSAHVHAAMLNTQAKLDLQHIPYRGASPLVTDIMGGQINSAFIDISSARAHLQSGKFKVLASTGAKRLKATPDTPTFTELGYQAFEPYGWFSVFVPASTPKPIVDKLSTEIARIVHTPEISARLEELSLMPVGSNATEFAATLKADSPKWLKVIKDNNIRLD